MKTLSGEKQLDFSLKHCKTHGLSNEQISVINAICPKNRTFDSKVMIAVGLLRWFLNLQREEIQLLFYARGTEISTGEISNLSEEFLLRFYIFHKKHLVQIKSLFSKKGGAILHLDGTGEAGDEIVFTAMEGRTNIKLDARIMPSESSKFIEPFLQSLKNTIGTPVVIMRDMSKNIQNAASEVFPNTPQLICHYHFISNLGKIIFKDEYESFRKKMVSTKILAQLVSLKRKLSDLTSFQSILVQAEHKWVSLAIEHLLWPRERPSGYPFVLPYYEIMNRVAEMNDLVKKIIEWNAEQYIAVNTVLDFNEITEKLLQRGDIKTHHSRLRRIWNWFEEVRKILEVSRDLKADEQGNEPKSAVEIKKNLQKLFKKIKGEADEWDKKVRNISNTIIRECVVHWEELTAEIKDENGNDVQIARNNGIVENNHRWSRMHTRRRTGRNRTTNDMAKYGALTSVLSNLENEIYVKEVLADVGDFVYKMQSISKEEIEDAKKLIQVNHKDPLVKSDQKRIGILHEFITILDQSMGKEKVDVGTWLNKLEYANHRMTS